jgi:cysteinyl-tRNA synthetase
MKIYNTLTKYHEEIAPIEKNKIKMYSCGPTVYRYIHIGNLRTFTMADWIRRVFEYRGIEVLHVKNITDVGHMRREVVDEGEDKVEAQARKEGKTSLSIAQFYMDAFLEDEAKLNILPAHIFPRASLHVPEMIEIIQKLEQKGVAYAVNGNVYFDIKRFPGYGKLSGNLLENMMAGTHEGVDTDRHNIEDFPLWKVAEPGREMAWDSPWGHGFPGWHIECSAMAMKYLGEYFDIHTGGVDNIFPHHEDEIAQSEAFSGHQYVNYWVHAQHLLTDGQKMAKATGNDYTLAEIEARGFEPMALRYFFTMALYRSRLNFTFRALQTAQTSLERLRNLAYQCLLKADRQHVFSDGPLQEQADQWVEAFLAAVENDLNMPRAMSIVWAMMHSQDDPTMKLRSLFKMDRILGLGLKEYLQSDYPQRLYEPETYLAMVPASIATQVRERDEMRRQHNYQQADQVRQGLKQLGYFIRDTPQGPLISPYRLDKEFPILTHSIDAPDVTHLPDLCDFSVNLLTHNSKDDVARCIESICRHVGNYTIEIVVIDNGSTDDTLSYLRQLARQGELKGNEGQRIGLRVLFADHNMGFAAGRNATMRTSRGHFIILMDTSIEITGNIWQLLAATLANPEIGAAGPYGLVTDDLREFSEAVGPQVDAIEGYLFAFRRELLPEVGWIDEKLRFYRLMDIFYSFFFKAAGYDIVTIPAMIDLIAKHPHREWYSLSEEERRTKSKKNYDIFRDRWHHGENLLAANYNAQNLWRGHDHAYHLEGTHTHTADELPPAGKMHSHTHRHWPDHSHEHPHYHNATDKKAEKHV